MSGETLRHIRLVEALIDLVEQRHQGNRQLIVFADHRQFGENRPPLLGGFTPDVYAQDLPVTLRVVGEAKTEADLDSDRSAMQLRGFLDHLALYENSTMYVAVPWIAAPRAWSLLKSLRGPEHRNITLDVVRVNIR